MVISTNLGYLGSLIRPFFLKNKKYVIENIIEWYSVYSLIKSIAFYLNFTIGIYIAVRMIRHLQ